MEVDYAIDLLFVLDLGFNSVTSYVNEEGEEVVEGKEIRKHYLMSGNLGLDVIAVIPFDDIVEWADAGINSTSLKIVRCLKLIRLFRLRRIISLLKIRKDIKLALKIMVVLYFLFLFIHICASLFSLMNSSSTDYTPPNDIGRPEYYYMDDLQVYRYWLSFYYVILMLLGADTVVFNTAQCAFAVVVLLLGSMITAVLFGEITVLVLNLNGHSANMQEALEASNDVMMSLKLPKSLVSLVNEFLSRTHNYRKRQSDLRQFFQMVPEDLKQQVITSVFSSAIHKCRLFDLDQYDKVLQNLTIMHTKPEETVVHRGERADSLFIVSSGELMVNACSSQGDENVFRRLSAGCYFGEVGVMLNTRRTATVTALNYCVLAVLSAEAFNRISTPALRWKAKEHIYQSYRETWRDFVTASLKLVPALAPLSDLELVLTAFQCKTLRLAHGSVLVPAGNAPESVFIVLSGKLEVNVGMIYKGEQVGIVTLTRGAVCYGTAALTRIPQAYALIARQEATVLQLDSSIVYGKSLFRAKKALSCCQASSGLICFSYYRL
jgi:voltage-gated potassium channel